MTDSLSLLDVANIAYAHKDVSNRSSKESWFRFFFRYRDHVHIITTEDGRQLEALLCAEQIDPAAIHIYFLLTFSPNGFRETVERIKELWPKITHVRYVRRHKQRFASLDRVEQLTRNKYVW